MSFVERLRQQLEAEKLAQQQREREIEAARKAESLAQQQRFNQEQAFHEQRRQQAEAFREESGVGAVVDKLVKFLEIPTIPITVTPIDREGGYGQPNEELIGRGSGGLSRGSVTTLKDPDSVCDIARWDTISSNGHPYAPDGNQYEYRYGTFSEKYIAVETCPDGTIIFHGGWEGSTTIRLVEWRTKNKEQIFDKALEKAYKNPGVNRFSTSPAPDHSYKC